jgi:hypothetical protein
MPLKTPDQLTARAAALRKKVAEKGASLDGTALRALKKNVRRVQRKRRRLVKMGEAATSRGQKKKE